MANRRDRATLARLAAQLNAQSVHAGNVPPLILLTDDERLPEPLAAVRALPHGSLVIVRSRDDRRRAVLAETILPIARARGLFMLIAGDPPLAWHSGADGIHLPQARIGELPAIRVRAPDWFVTCAAHDTRTLTRAEAFGADAALLSPVFATKSHPGASQLGPMRMAALVRAVCIPVYALGGIDHTNARRLAGTGAAGLAAIGALSPSDMDLRI